MPGVGYSYHPDKSEKERSKDDVHLHLWKNTGVESSESYCGEHKVDQKVSGMTQITQSRLEDWRNNNNVCGECVDAVEEKFYS